MINFLLTLRESAVGSMTSKPLKSRFKVSKPAFLTTIQCRFSLEFLTCHYTFPNNLNLNLLAEI